MKKLLLMLIVVGMLIGSGCSKYSTRNYAILGGGYGGPTKSANLTIEGLQIKENRQGRNSLIGGGFTMIFNSGDVEGDEITSGDYSDLFQLECSIDTVDEGETGRGSLPEMGLFGKYGIEVAKDTGLFVTGFGGFTIVEESYVLYPYSYEESEWTTYGMFGGGLSYLLNNNSYIQVDYDNRRGTTVGLGWKF